MYAVDDYGSAGQEEVFFQSYIAAGKQNRFGKRTPSEYPPKWPVLMHPYSMGYLGWMYAFYRALLKKYNVEEL